MGEWSSFVGKVLGGVKKVFLSCCPQVLSCLNLGCRGIFKTRRMKEDFMENFLMLLNLFLKHLSEKSLVT